MILVVPSSAKSPTTTPHSQSQILETIAPQYRQISESSSHLQDRLKTLNKKLNESKNILKKLETHPQLELTKIKRGNSATQFKRNIKIFQDKNKPNDLKILTPQSPGHDLKVSQMKSISSPNISMFTPKELFSPKRSEYFEQNWYKKSNQSRQIVDLMNKSVKINKLIQKFQTQKLQEKKIQNHLEKRLKENRANYNIVDHHLPQSENINIYDMEKQSQNYNERKKQRLSVFHLHKYQTKWWEIKDKIPDCGIGRIKQNYMNQ